MRLAFWRRAPRIELHVSHKLAVEETPELVAGALALRENPSFRMLLDRLEFQRSALRSRLETAGDPREIAHLQSGIFWTGWLDKELRRYAASPRPLPRELNPSERQVFEMLQSSIQGITDDE